MVSSTLDQAKDAGEIVIEDDNIWLEGVTDEKALDWVKSVNEKSLQGDADIGLKALKDPTNGGDKALYDRILSILESKEKIPSVRKREQSFTDGKNFFNYWQDDQHVRGIWRRTSWEEYQKKEPDWEVILDVDALGKAEGKSWVWKGAQVLDVPGEKRDLALVMLSDGGADATYVREFNLETKEFLKEDDANAFHLNFEAKHRVYWRDRDTVFIGTNWGEGTLTDSGYPRQCRVWKRGSKFSDAENIFEGKKEDVAITIYYDQEVNDNNYEIIEQSPSFFESVYYLRNADGVLEKCRVPESVELSFYGDQAIIKLRKDWTGFDGKQNYKSGSLLACYWEYVLRENVEGKCGDVTVLFEPSPETSMESWTHTKNYLIMTCLHHVKSVIKVWAYNPTGSSVWSKVGSDFAGAGFEEISVEPIDSMKTDDVFVTNRGFTQPSKLSHSKITADGVVALTDASALKSLPHMYDATDVEVSQEFATSKDGTKVPYFVVKKKNALEKGPAPTLLYGYGGFEISLTPGYSPAVGAGWLEKGNIFVEANIRGGGEYGPQWHQQALKEKRNKAYEDFIAIGEDLVAKKFTTKKLLGIQGGSNGGLLMGNMYVMRPDLFNAVVCQVPLLDMKRFHTLLAGASWTGEYGDPAKGEWEEFLWKYSPYQHLRKEDVDKYPNFLGTTSTRDDRVHPGHARKWIKRLLDIGAGGKTWYWENMEGGHGNAADAKQRAYMSTLIYQFLDMTLVENDAYPKL